MAERIRVDNLSFRYKQAHATGVFEDLSFSVSTGDLMCLLGPNGTGKSTLLKCMNGILKPETGCVQLDGMDISALSRQDIAKKVGYVPQSQTSVFPFRVRDVIVMGRTPHLSVFASPSKHDHEITDEVISRVGITHIADKPCTMISGGEWQLVLIARALAQQPEILLLDEPTSHLDMGNQLRILDVVHALTGTGITVVMASHFPDHAYLSANRAAILKDKTFTALGTPDEVVTEDLLKETYGVNVKVLYVKEAGRKVCVPVRMR